MVSKSRFVRYGVCWFSLHFRDVTKVEFSLVQGSIALVSFEILLAAWLFILRSRFSTNLHVWLRICGQHKRLLACSVDNPISSRDA